MKDIFLRTPSPTVLVAEPSLLKKQTGGETKYLVVKRIFDLIVAGLTLMFICSWLFPLIAIIIKATSGGPVIFKQLRHGRHNMPFYCYKFRTMIDSVDADKVQASREDARVTKFGAFLRRSSLDELPQLFNVLQGKMSIVGPRPHAVPMNEVFFKIIPGYSYRHDMKPGLTGLTQSKGYRGEILDFHDLYSRYRLDLFYIKNWGLIFDLKIIVWTAYCLLLKNHKAY